MAEFLGLAYPAFENLSGFTKSEVLGQNPDHMITTRATNDEAVELTCKVLNGETVEQTGQHQRKDGTLIDYGWPRDLHIRKYRHQQIPRRWWRSPEFTALCRSCHVQSKGSGETAQSIFFLEWATELNCWNQFIWIKHVWAPPPRGKRPDICTPHPSEMLKFHLTPHRPP